MRSVAFSHLPVVAAKSVRRMDSNRSVSCLQAMRGLLRDLPAEPLAAYVVGAVMPFYIRQGLHVDTSAQSDSGDAAVAEWQDTILPDVLQAVLAEAFRVAKLQRTPPVKPPSFGVRMLQDKTQGSVCFLVVPFLGMYLVQTRNLAGLVTYSASDTAGRLRASYDRA